MSQYAGLISVSDASALILGDLPLATAIWDKSLSEIYIVRAIYMEPGTEIRQFMDRFEEAQFGDPLKSISFECRSTPLVVFDSAYPGRDQRKELLQFALLPGNYEIRATVFDPNEQTSFVLHRFSLRT